MDEPNAAAPALRRRRFARVVRAALIALVVVVAAIVGAIAWLTSETALMRALAELTARSGGALSFEGAAGSLLHEMRARRIEYRDAHVHVVADEVTLTWSPAALWSRELRIRGLGAQRIVVTLEPSDTRASPPESLALPLDVTVAHAGVARLELVSGDAARAFEGVAFAYAGGPTVHRFTDLALVSDWGKLAGETTLAAHSPFGMRGAFALTASERLARAAANVTLGGTLTALDVRFAARAGDATANGRASVAPLAALPLAAAMIDIHGVDAAQFNAAWPRTLVDATLDAKLDPQDRYIGTLEASNAAAGPIDAGRIPLVALDARFAFSPKWLELDELTANFGAGGRASGRARIELASSEPLPPSEWDLAVRELDLARLYRPAIATKLGGRLRAHVERGVQHVDADLAQGDRALAFVATIAGASVDVERFRARAGTGEAAGHAKLTLTGARRFDIAATTTRFDPSRFFATPAASLDGTIDATGQLGSQWSAGGRVALQPTSRVVGLAASGSARGRVSASAIADATIDAKLGDASLRANGSFGRPGDTLAFNIDLPQLATLAPLVGSRWPASLAGSWRARGTLTGDADGPGGDVTASAERLVYDAYSIGTLDVRATIAAARAQAGANVMPAAQRPLAVVLAATDVRTPEGRYAKAGLRVDGTLTHHVANVSVTGDDLDANARLDGGFRVAGFNWREGRIDTRGTFNGVPAAAIARLAGAQLPMRSTLVLGGDWDIAAAPRLAGTLHVRRERGDLFAGAGVLSAGEIALGLDALELAAAVANDTVDASAMMRASSFGTASAMLRVGNVAGASAGVLAPDAPVAATLKADIASLKPLQPLLGTTALVDGRIAVDGEAKGTRRNLAVSGSLVASDVKLAAPQYGVHWTNGRVRARLAGGVLALDELSLDGGDGRFTANGTLVAFRRDSAAGVPNEPSTSVAWRAERFRATNRPDMRLVVDGRGTLGASQGRLLLKGELNAVEGRFEIARPTTSTLGPDVVVAGIRREPPPERFQNIPLALDVDLDLGNRLEVTGRGLDARLAGHVTIATSVTRQLTARGSIRTVSGTYDAFGQRLTIQRGRLIFDGPIDNPALDVVAVRRNLPVEAGVEVTGTVNIPRVQLVSDPPVSDGEKLSWLVLGQGLERTSSADAAALQAAAATLFGDNRAPIGTTLARQIGLDDIALRSASTTTAVRCSR